MPQRNRAMFIKKLSQVAFNNTSDNSTSVTRKYKWK